MGINVGLKSGDDKPYLVEVTEKGAIKVEILPTTPPPAGTPSELLPFTELAVIDGGSSINMNVDGSVTPVEFKVNAEANSDRFITSVTLVMIDSLIREKNFGNEPALTNGFDVKENLNGVDQFVVTKAKTTLDLETYTLNNYAKETQVNASNDSSISLVITPGTPVRLGKGTTDSFLCVVNDDLTGLVEFFCRVIGYRQL